jgi:hypothetical protein
MAWKKATFKLTSVCPLIPHNGELANPMNPLVQQMKKLSGKRSKTEADLVQLAKFEFLGGLYIDKDLGIVLPAEVIESAFNGGARKFKEGMTAKSGMYIPSHAKLLYQGEQDPEKLWEDKNFVFQKMVVVTRSRILRTRPIFNEWSANVEVSYEDTVADLVQVTKWIKAAGQNVGFCDWRPRFGRFEAALVG